MLLRKEMCSDDLRNEKTLCSVIPAKAGIHPSPLRSWMPAYAGMTSLRKETLGRGLRHFHDL